MDDLEKLLAYAKQLMTGNVARPIYERGAAQAKAMKDRLEMFDVLITGLEELRETYHISE